MLTGEELDVQSYYARRSKTDKRPDYDEVSIAIQPWAITAALSNAAGIAEPEPNDVPYAIGRFVTTTPRSDGFCVADKLATAQLHLPEVAEHELDMCTTAPAAPSVDVSYAFKNLRVYYTPAAIGTQLTADLTYTQAGCVAKYRVAAVYPMVSCAVATPLEAAGASDAAIADAMAPADAAEIDRDASDADLDAGEIAGANAPDADVDAGLMADAGACPPPEPPTGPPAPDDSVCEGAGINPDFAVKCDPAAMMCVLAKAAPSLR